jgi:hypothetical protein
MVEAMLLKTEVTLTKTLADMAAKGYRIRDIKFAITTDDKPRFLVIYEV